MVERDKTPPSFVELLGASAKDSIDPADESEELLDKIQLALTELRAVMAAPERLARLHAVERMIAEDVLQENRHLNCRGCLRWVEALVRKGTIPDAT